MKPSGLILVSLASWVPMKCSAFLVSTSLCRSGVATVADEGRVPRLQKRPLQMATESAEERKKRIMEKTKSRMARRAMMRSKKTYRPPISYPRRFTPELRDAQKKLIDSPEMKAYMMSLIEDGYMVEIDGTAVTAEILEASSPTVSAEEEQEEEVDTSDEGSSDADPSASAEVSEDSGETGEEPGKDEQEEEAAGEDADKMLGAGGMADTRDPEPMDHEDPRKSISSAPTFEEYLKSRPAS